MCSPIVVRDHHTRDNDRATRPTLQRVLSVIGDNDGINSNASHRSELTALKMQTCHA